MISFFANDSSATILMLCIVLMAIGNGMFLSPNNAIVMSSIPREYVGVGGSINALVRNIGQNFGVFISTCVLYSGISRALGYHVTDYRQTTGSFHLWHEAYVPV
jgi:MFS family permease